MKAKKLREKLEWIAEKVGEVSCGYDPVAACYAIEDPLEECVELAKELEQEDQEQAENASQNGG